MRRKLYFAGYVVFPSTLLYRLGSTFGHDNVNTSAEDDNVFTFVGLFVCLSVNNITQQLADQFSRGFGRIT